MMTKNKAGKSLITLPKGAISIAPQPVTDLEQDLVAAISNEGRLLIFPVVELPVMARGKGNKIMNIPAARIADRTESMPFVIVFSDGDTVIVHSGKRHLKLKPEDIEHYRGERARRGLKLPRGFQKVDRVEKVQAE
ncbi:MAG: DNA gyrase C-terminal beta-propeller domain-containing protein [Gammaproteobacteria bacterium]|nr:DNA gyrase C-terminal beta-propeller domain-containing protein [Gammaproteobacteria bacterium]